jgi:hypothetical protein
VAGGARRAAAPSPPVRVSRTGAEGRRRMWTGELEAATEGLWTPVRVDAGVGARLGAARFGFVSGGEWSASESGLQGHLVARSLSAQNFKSRLPRTEN